MNCAGQDNLELQALYESLTQFGEASPSKLQSLRKITSDMMITTKMFPIHLKI